MKQPHRETGNLSAVVLSMRNINPFVGWVPIDEFEDLFVNLTQGTLFAPPPQTSASMLLTKGISRLRKASRK